MMGMAPTLTTDADVQAEYENIREVLLQAGETLKEQFRMLSSHQAEENERFDLVTACDRQIEEFLIAQLRSLYPEHSIYAEESGAVTGSPAWRWIVDPIDGTANFIFGVPHVGISLALENRQRIEEAYVYCPFTEELYYASRRLGQSYLNGAPIRVSETAELRECLVSFGFSAHMRNIARYYADWAPLFDNAKKAMPLLSPSLNLCNVARGRIDCFIDFGSSMEGHAAAALIVQNAGGKVTNYDLTAWDHRTKGIVATNGRISIQSDPR